MALLWLPDATRDQHGAGLAWTETTDPKGCLHTTEGVGWPTYQGWTVQPHGTVMPHPHVGVEIRQHIPLNQGSYSLRHTDPSQPTNTDYVWQWELIGTSDPHGPSSAYFWPEADDAVLADLGRKLIKPLSDAYRIPLVTPPWLAYPASFGASSVRLSNHQFDVFSGWLGHEHVPQNDHGDPGLFPWARLMALMTPMTQTPKDEDMIIVNQPYSNPDGQRADRKWLLAGSRRALIPNSAAYHVWLEVTGQDPAKIVDMAGADLELLPSIDSDPTVEEIVAALPQSVQAIPDADLVRIAKAVADEQARRMTS